jgi:polyribonucleotide nucleotidyltransferase
MKQEVTLQLGRRQFTIQTGVMAKQADGAALVSYGDSVVLTTVVAGEVRESQWDDAMVPLTVDYREKTSAAGKIPGGFFKREGRPTTEEILTMRLIDRPLRPLFPEGFQNEIQIMSMVLSAENNFDPDILAINGASACLVLSGIPFNGPIGAVKVGKINGTLTLNPEISEMKESTLDIVIAGTADAVLMVEGGAKEESEEALLEAIEFGHKAVKELVALQKQLKTDKKKMEVTPPEFDKALYEKMKKEISSDLKSKILIKGKHERHDAVSEIKKKQIETYCAGLTEADAVKKTKLVKAAFTKIEEEIIRELIAGGKRMDGRSLTEIRPITCDLGILPRTHGSALFTRGETQALVVATLGTADDEQIIDGLADEYVKRFMLHYNFPPFSVGEIKPLRGPGRREIGHGHLAERAIEGALPEFAKFPYTIRVVSDILESNGSSSMATVCGATLSLMDAGVPIKSPVAGIAMGLVKEGNDISILSDILGSEDKYGDMDFKVAGTAKGITGFQMDIKVGGLSTDIMKKALAQAKEGRLHILGVMEKSIATPRTDISAYAPRVVRLMIKPDKIGAVIGGGGKTIRRIQEETGVKIEIEDTGEVIIYGKDAVSLDAAKKQVEGIVEEAEIGKIYQGKVVSIKDFGAFVEILVGQEGLVHISELSNRFVGSVLDVVKMGDIIPVKCIGIDDQGKIKLSRKQAVDPASEPPVPEGMQQERPPRPYRENRFGGERRR